jgi:hypothetical protein
MKDDRERRLRAALAQLRQDKLCGFCSFRLSKPLSAADINLYSGGIDCIFYR